MSRYIDADKTKKHFGDYFEKVGIARRYAESIVDNAIPTADVVEVKHGHWDFYGLIDDIYGHGASCSVCGGYSEDNGYYCSCCGAKMDDALQRKTNPEAF